MRCRAIQRDPGSLRKWANRNLMKINTGKCQVLHLGSNNSLYQYKVGADWLESGSEEKGLQILVIKKLSMRELLHQRWPILSCVSKNIVHSFRKVTLPLYLPSVTPQTGTVSSLELPSKGRYFHTGASVVKTIKLFSPLEHKMHEERLKELGLFSPLKR